MIATYREHAETIVTVTLNSDGDGRELVASCPRLPVGRAVFDVRAHITCSDGDALSAPTLDAVSLVHGSCGTPGRPSWTRDVSGTLAASLTRAREAGHLDAVIAAAHVKRLQARIVAAYAEQEHTRARIDALRDELTRQQRERAALDAQLGDAERETATRLANLARIE